MKSTTRDLVAMNITPIIFHWPKGDKFNRGKITGLRPLLQKNSPDWKKIHRELRKFLNEIILHCLDGRKKTFRLSRLLFSLGLETYWARYLFIGQHSTRKSIYVEIEQIVFPNEFLGVQQSFVAIVDALTTIETNVKRYL